MRTHLWKVAGLSFAAIALVAACDNKPADTATTTPAAQTPPPAPPAPPPPDYASLLGAADRVQADKDRDADRHPAEVLAVSKIMPGQTVFEIEAGGGYYTELLSKAVGPNGKVTMQGPKEFESFYKKDMDARLANNRLANVRVSQSEFDKLDAADGSADVVTWFLGPHELYCKKDCGNAPLGEPAKAFAEAFRVLKPGGYFVVMDHVAKEGSPTTSGNDLHRIDPMQVKAMATTAGFVMDEESKLLANAADDHSKPVFDKSIRGKTDQILLRYKKPG